MQNMQNLLKFYRKNSSTIILDVCDFTFKDGDTLYFTVKPAPDNDETDSSALIKAHWVIGTDVNVETDGTLQLKLTPTETDIDFGQYFYDIKLVEYGDTAENTLITGDIAILDVATLRV